MEPNRDQITPTAIVYNVLLKQVFCVLNTFMLTLFLFKTTNIHVQDEKIIRTQLSIGGAETHVHV